MKTDDVDFMKLEQGLRELPQAVPPDAFVEDVMRRLPRRSPRRLTWRGRLAAALAVERTISFRPARLLAAAACLLVVFGAGFYFGEKGQRTSLAAEYAVASHRMGRMLLEENQPARALPYLSRASRLAPDNAEFFFWQGLAYSALAKPEQEERFLRKAVAVDPGYLPATLYLGHNALDSGRWKLAVAQYDAVLDRDSGNLPALYNRGLALRQLGRTAEEVESWKLCLRRTSSGRWAYEAVRRLNESGDYSYRAHQIGPRKVIVRTPDFSTSDPLRPVDAENLRTMLERNSGLILHVVAFEDGDAALARSRVRALREELVRGASKDIRERVRLSWFGEPEYVRSTTGRYRLDSSVLFIGLIRDGHNNGGPEI